MPDYRVTLEDGRSYKVSSDVELDGYSAEQYARQQAAQEDQLAEEREAKQGFFPGMQTGFGHTLGTGLYGLGEQLGIEGLQEKGLEVREAAQEKSAPMSTDDISAAFDQGFGPGAEELADYTRLQTGQVTGGLPPYLVARGTGAGIGGLLGLPLGPLGVAAGAGAGSVLAPAATYFFGENKLRQQEEIDKAIEAGQVPPEFDYWDAMGPAIGQSAAELLGLKIIGKFFPRFGEMIGVTSKKDADKLIQDIASGKSSRVGNTVKGAAAGTATEVPVELTQTVLERQAAGLPLTDAEAYKEYEEVAAATVAGVAPLGGVAGAMRSTQPRQVEPEETVPPTDEAPQDAMPEPEPEGPEPFIRGQEPQTQPPASPEEYEQRLNQFEEQELERARQSLQDRERARQFEDRLAEVEAGELDRARQQLEAQRQRRRDEIDRRVFQMQRESAAEIQAASTAREDVTKDLEREARTQRKAMDAAYQQRVEGIRVGETQVDNVTPQVIEAMGIPKRNKRLRREIEGVDLTTMEGREQVQTALENMAPPQVAENEFAKRLQEQVETDRRMANEQEQRNRAEDDTLQMLYDEAVASGDPQQMQRVDQIGADRVGIDEWNARKEQFAQQPDAISRDYLDMYREAQATGNQERMAQIDTAARDALGPSKWAGVKSGSTRSGQAKLRAINEGRTGRQLELGAQQEQEQPADGGVQTAEEPVPSRRARKSRKQARQTEPETTDQGVETPRDAEQTDTEGAETPDVGRLDDTGRDAERPATRDGDRDATLDDVEAEVQAEEEAEPRGNRSAMEAGAINMRNTLERLDPEDRQQLEPLVDQFDEMNRVNEGKPPTRDEKEILGLLTERVNQALNKVIRRDVDQRQAAEDAEYEASIARRGNRVPRSAKKKASKEQRQREAEVKQIADNISMEMPRAAVELFPFMAGGMRNNAQLLNAVNTATDEGFFTDQERDTISGLLGKLENRGGELKIQTRAAIVDSMIDRMSQSAYMQNNPEMVRNIHKALNEGIVRYYAGLDAVREVFGQLAPQQADDSAGYEFSRAGRPGEPKATKAELEALAKPISRKLKDQNIQIVQSTKDLPIVVPDDVRGMVHRGDVYIVADNTSPLEFQRVAAHEIVGHTGMEGILGQGGFKSFVSSVNTLRDRSPRVKQIVENIRQNYTNPNGEYNLTREQEAREILAHIAEGLPNYLTDSGIARVWNNVKTKVAQWLANIGLGNIADADLNRLVYEASQFVQNGRSAVGRGQFLSRDYGGAHMMNRAWRRGYRGTDPYEAGEHLRGVHDGSIIPQATRFEDLKDENPDVTTDIDFSIPAYARQGKMSNFGDKYDELDYEPPKDPGLFRQNYDSIRDGSMFKKFRVAMVDSHATVDDKIASIYRGTTRMADGLVNPSITASQAMRAEGLAADWMKTGHFEWDEENGLWKAADMTWDKDKGQWNINRNEDTPNFADLVKNVAALAKHKKIRSKKRAAQLFRLATIAQREEQLNEKKKRVVKEIQEAQDKGATQEEINKLEEEIPTLTMTEAEREKYLEFWDEIPELNEIFEDWTAMKNNLVDQMVVAGVISEKKAGEWKDNFAYVPFFRIQETAEGENYIGGVAGTGTGLSSVQQLKKLRGSKKEINDVLDNMARVSNYMITSAVRNKAAQQLIRGLEKVPGAVVGKISGPGNKQTEHGAVVSYYDKGVKTFYELADPMDAYAFKGIEEIGGLGMQVMARVADWLRKGVTLSPEFIIAQTENDMARGYMLSGVKEPVKIPLKVLSSYAGIRYNLAKGGLGDTALNAVGVTGMYDYSPRHTREQVESAYKEGELSPLQKLFRFGERNAEASDMALRKAIFDQTMNETGDLALATMRANEIVNFNRRGASTFASLLRQVIPFQNAYMQGMNVLGKAMSGRGLSSREKSEALKYFWGLGLRVATLSTIYALMMTDEDEYQDQPDYVRARYYMFPVADGMPMVKFSMPPDLGFMFKVIPETMVGEFVNNYADDKQLRTDIRNAAVMGFIGPTAIPQVARPVLEQVTDYSFLTGAPLLGRSMENKPLEDQFRSSTSELGRLLGQTGVVSPIRFDHLVNGFFGSIGGTMLNITDEIAQQAFGINRPDKQLSRQNITKAFFTAEFGGGGRSRFYELRDKVRGVVSAVNQAEERGDFERMQELLEDYEKEYAAADMVNAINQEMVEINKIRRVIEADPDMSGAEKRERLDELDEMSSSLNKNIRELRGFVYGD